jgi:hypothetical protein
VTTFAKAYSGFPVELAGVTRFCFYQGTTSVVPPLAKIVRALAPATVKSARNSNGQERKG